MVTPRNGPTRRWRWRWSKFSTVPSSAHKPPTSCQSFLDLFLQLRRVAFVSGRGLGLLAPTLALAWPLCSIPRDIVSRKLQSKPNLTKKDSFTRILCFRQSSYADTPNLLAAAITSGLLSVQVPVTVLIMLLACSEASSWSPPSPLASSASWSPSHP